MNAKKINPIRETDEAARQQARLLIRGARFGAIAAIDPETGYPNCSRVLLGTTADGTPVVLVSRLSAHTKALLENPKASLLVGEPGKGDPLAWPRLTIQCDAVPVERQSEDDKAIRARFIRRHEKAALYADFGDFLFMRLTPVRASLNGGFGKAYAMTSSDLTFAGNESVLDSQIEETLLPLANHSWHAQVDKYKRLKGYESWKICGIDLEGVDARKGSLVQRFIYKELLNAKIVQSSIETGVFAPELQV